MAAIETAVGRPVKPVILNADDYGFDRAVDLAILRLAELGVVTSTSVMTLAPRWPEAGRAALDAPLDLGLHLDLTSPFAEAESGFAESGLAGLVAAAFGRRLDRTWLRRTIDMQLSRFEQTLRAPPVFVDGHQHVHQLPVVRDELIRALTERYGREAARVRLRSCWSRRWRGGKAAIVAATGALALTRMALVRGHRVNSDFIGVYDFSPQADLAALWRRWLSDAAGTEPLAMCHPALVSSACGDAPAFGPRDSIRPAREREFTWLSSDEFGELYAQLQVSFVRAPR